ncbi:unnamed protein product, partial [Brassica napus]
MTHHKFPMLHTCQYSDGVYLAAVKAKRSFTLNGKRHLSLPPNHRRRRKKYAIVEPHEPRLIHHISTITNERRNKGGKEYSSPRRSKTRNGSSASKIVEKESKEKLSRVVCISRLSKANKLNHKCDFNEILNNDEKIRRPSRSDI